MLFLSVQTGGGDDDEADRGYDDDARQCCG
jgi:hypothetical protein